MIYSFSDRSGAAFAFLEGIIYNLEPTRIQEENKSPQASFAVMVYVGNLAMSDFY